MADWAVCGGSSSVGIRLVAVGTSNSMSVFSPKDWAVSIRASAPMSRPISPKVVLHDTSRARRRVMLPPAQLRPDAKLPICAVVCGRSRNGGSSKVSSGLPPRSSSAAAVTTLKVDPGAYSSLVARFSRGLAGSASSRSHASRMAVPSWLDSSLGS